MMKIENTSESKIPSTNFVGFQHPEKSQNNFWDTKNSKAIFKCAKNLRFLSMKKAQVEIMGLTIALLLIILGIVFVYSFISENGPIQYKKQFTQTELASNTINTLLKTTSDCNGLSMTELLQDCSQNQNVVCLEDQNSCDYVTTVAEQIFRNTLEKWGISYEFEVFFDEENPILVIGEACVGDKKSKTFPIPTDSGILKVKMDVCG